MVAFSTQAFREEYPFESHYLNINNMQYHYLLEGKGAQTIVMVHGNPTWSFYYRNLVKKLSKDFQVVVPDHIGCGLSDKPQDYTYRLQDHIDNLCKLVEHLKLENIHLVLHDWGGAIGMGMAQKYPKKIKKFTILNTASFLLPVIPFSINICKIPIFGDFVIRGLNGFAGPAIKMASKKKGQMNAIIKKGYLAPYHNWATRIATHRFVKDIPMESSHPSWNTMTKIEMLLDLFKDTPMHIFWGKLDFCFNDHFLAKWKSIFPKAKVKEYVDAGHYVLEDAKPEIIDDIANWAKENEH
jgi:pimeloyl-ACP methyl ester carboxylesterase